MESPARFNRFDFLKSPVMFGNYNIDSITEFNFNYKFRKIPVTTMFIREMRNLFEARATMLAYRTSDTDFTRERYYTFPGLAVSILKDHGRPAQTRVAHIFDDCGFRKNKTCPTASAFIQARAKLDPAFYEMVASYAAKLYYSNFPKEGLVATWGGKYLWGVDCSTLIIPDTPETRSTFSAIKNAGSPTETVYGMVGFAYDLLNDFVVSYRLDKRIAEKDFLFNTHFQHMSGSVIAIYDRAYMDYEVIARHSLIDSDFVIRCKTASSFKMMDEFMQSKDVDRIVQLPASAGKGTLMRKLGLPMSVVVRFVKIILNSGEVEVLVTSLLDQAKYSVSDFAWLYGKRWGVETSFMRFKRQLDVECFSSKKVFNIKQDINAAIFLMVFEAILNKAQDIDMTFQSINSHRKLEYCVNKAGAFAMISDYLVGFFIEDKHYLGDRLDAYQQKIRLYKSPIRPSRKFPRDKKTSWQRLHFFEFERIRR